MVRHVIRLCFALSIFWAAPSVAQELLGRYQARLSERDHFNSSGQRLANAAVVIRQDRANYHRFGLADPEDQQDQFFADPKNREILEALLQRGRADPSVVAEIINGTPLVQVEVWRGRTGIYVIVTRLPEPSAQISTFKSAAPEVVANPQPSTTQGVAPVTSNTGSPSTGGSAAGQPQTMFDALIGDWTNTGGSGSTIRVERTGDVWTSDHGLSRTSPTIEAGGNFAFENKKFKCVYYITFLSDSNRANWRLVAGQDDTCSSGVYERARLGVR